MEGLPDPCHRDRNDTRMVITMAAHQRGPGTDGNSQIADEQPPLARVIIATLSSTGPQRAITSPPSMSFEGSALTIERVAQHWGWSSCQSATAADLWIEWLSTIKKTLRPA